MNKLYAIFIIILIGMMIPEVTDAQGSGHLNRIDSGNKTQMDLKTFLEYNDYEPIVHHSINRVAPKAKAEIIIVSPGQLSNILTANQEATITNLILSGQIDARDFKTMRDAMPVLSDIDISSISIAAYTGPQGTAGSIDFTYPANAIPQKAFFSDANLISVILPANITSIGDSAFFNCGLSGDLTIPNGVITIGNSAFESCWNLTGTITLPNSVTTIGTSIFADCQNFTNLTLSNSLTSISDHAFDGDLSLQGNLTIPNSVTLIGDYAFFYSYLTGITVPNSVTSIGIGAFDKCKFLNVINIPNSITSISDYAFALCARLTSITIPISVISIGNYAFTMSGLMDTTIPNSVTSIGDYAFAFTGNIVIPYAVTSIGVGAFYFSGLTSISISNSASFIGSLAFASCSRLISIYANPTIPLDLSSMANVFDQVNKSTCTLYVPVGSKSLYQSANQWKDFTNIVEMAPTGINELTDNGNIILYPNPVTDGCYIYAGENRAMVSLYNLSGVQLVSIQVTNKSYLDMTGLPSGQYIVKINTSNGIVEKKLIKK